MKQDKTELDIDFIGGQGALTREEEKKISEFIKANKAKSLKMQTKRKKRVSKTGKAIGAKLV